MKNATQELLNSIALKVVGSAVGGFIALIVTIMGGWDMALTTLLGVMGLDVLLGLLRAIYQRKVSSDIGIKGIVKKMAMLAIVAVAQFVGAYTQTPILRDVTIGAFIAAEVVSIVENAIAMGITLPEQLTNIFAKANPKKFEKTNGK